MTNQVSDLALKVALKTRPCDAPFPDTLPRVHPPDCKCKGTGQVPLFEGVRDECGHWSGDECGDKGCPGFTATLDLGRWLEAGSLQFRVKIQNDGPGWRADIYPNRIGAAAIATGWSDGFPEGEYDVDKPTQWRPLPIEALLRGLDKATEEEETMFEPPTRRERQAFAGREEEIVLNHKFGTPWPSMDALCNQCQQSYGDHCGPECPKEAGQ